MKTIIVYATKYGTTQKCAEELAKKIEGETDLFDLKKGTPDLSSYDTVIVGAPLYAGRIPKAATRFCSDQEKNLSGKRRGFFLCGMSSEETVQGLFNTAFPASLTANAACVFAGGEYLFSRMNFAERLIVKKISGSDQDQSLILSDNLTGLAESFNRTAQSV